MYPAKDLSEYYASMGFDTAYDNLPDKEVIDFHTISLNPAFYEFGDEGAPSYIATVQARILRKNHDDLLSIIDILRSSLDGKLVTIGNNSYEVFVNSVVYQGFRTTITGLMRYAVVTLSINY